MIATRTLSDWWRAAPLVEPLVVFTLRKFPSEKVERCGGLAAQTRLVSRAAPFVTRAAPISRGEWLPARRRSCGGVELLAHEDYPLHDGDCAERGQHVDGGGQQLEVADRGALGEHESDRQDYHAYRPRGHAVLTRAAARAGLGCRRPSASRARWPRPRRRPPDCGGRRSRPQPRSARSPPPAGQASSPGTPRTESPCPTSESSDRRACPSQSRR